MSCILHIETSTEACSVAVSEDGWNEFKVADLNGPQHAVQLGVFVDEALSFVDSHGMVLDAVAVSCGPGSYTGLRIGVSMAKGICYGRNLPLIALPTLEVMCVPVLLQQELPEDALLCPMIDARRMEVYTQLFNAEGKPEGEVSAEIINEESFAEVRRDGRPFVIFGNGAKKCAEVLSGTQFVEVAPSARGLARLAEEAFEAERFEDLAYFEPFYLKDFVVTTSKKKLF